MSDLNRVIVVPIELKKHPNADLLSLVRVFDNFTVCVRTEEWQGKTIGAYIPPDNVVPDNSTFAFLNGKFRITTKKFCGIISQGLLMEVPETLKVGDDVTDYFGVTRYVPEVDKKLESGVIGISPDNPGLNYDLESWFKYSSVFNDGEEVVLTEKIHGANLKTTFQQDTMWVSSHKFYRDPEDKNSIFWKAVNNNPWIEDFCRKNPNTFLYAEIFGWVQKLKYDAIPGQLMVRCFDVFDGVKFWDKEKLFDHFSSEQLVPLVYRGPYSEEIINTHMNGQSLIANNIREGIVIHPIKERYNERIGRVALKAVSPEYLGSKNNK